MTNFEQETENIINSQRKPTESAKRLEIGDYIKYDSGKNGEIMCRVLYSMDSEYGLQIISDKNVKTVSLGVNDNFELSKMSYNSLVETLNNEALEFVNNSYAYDGRCIGSIPTVVNGMFTKKNSEILGPVTMQFSYNGNMSIDLKNTDTNYEIDVKQMEIAKVIKSDNAYWLASHYVNSQSSKCDFCGCYMENGVFKCNGEICIINSTNTVNGYMRTLGFRPCISLKYDTIKIISGDGKTEDTAYVIGN